MRIKTGINGAKVAGLKPEIILAFVIAGQVYSDIAGIEAELTEGTGGKHGRGSLHYVGLAADLGIKGLSKTGAAQVVMELRDRLGEAYDVLLEADHIHIEFQPK